MVNFLRKIRKSQGMTQKTLADMTKVGRSTISNIETGRYVPGVDIALKLAHALGCKVEDLFILKK